MSTLNLGERMCPQVTAPPTEPLSSIFENCSQVAHASRLDWKKVRDCFHSGGKLAKSDALWIITRAAQVLASEPNVLPLSDPITIVGDIHGQFFDLMTVFQLGGELPMTQYLFLGDYVDRGYFSTEVTLLLYTLKVLYPTRIWLLRGNHECRHLTTYFNFKSECIKKYDLDVYDAFQDSFDALPLAALLNDRFLCVHGGLSPDIRCVDDISLIDRFREPPTTGPMCDILWADPMEEEEEQLCPDALFLFNELRGCSYAFSYEATARFLKENQLMGIIRAHEAQDEGYRLFRKVAETGFPSVICVFSAPNYCDTYENKAAILQICDDQVIHLRQFHSVRHPYLLPNFMHAFDWSTPFVVDRVNEIIAALLHVPLPDPGAEGGSGEVVARGGGRRSPTQGPHHCKVLQARGRKIRAKIKAVVRWILILKEVRSRVTMKCVNCEEQP